MKPLMTPFMALGILFLSGCSAQRVSTSGYLAPNLPPGEVSPSATIAVLPNLNVPNPIFDAAVKAKIENWLKQRGYQTAAPDQAQYYMQFAYDLEGETVPARRGFFGFPGASAFYVSGSNYYDPHFGAGLGFGTYVNNPNVLYTAKLRLRLAKANGQSMPPPEDILWVGEAVTETEDPDLRKMMNYLLAAALRFFMSDTKETKTLELTSDHEEVQKMIAVDAGRPHLPEPAAGAVKP